MITLHTKYAKTFTILHQGKVYKAIAMYNTRLTEATKERLALNIAQALGEPLDNVRDYVNTCLKDAPDRNASIIDHVEGGRYDYKADGCASFNQPQENLFFIDQEGFCHA